MRQVLRGGKSPAMPPPKAKTRLGTFPQAGDMMADKAMQTKWRANVRIQATLQRYPRGTACDFNKSV
jgi:hypothetical protein